MESLQIVDCTSIEKLDLRKSNELKKLDAQNCKNLVKIQGLNSLKFLEVLIMSGCISFGMLPDICCFQTLRKLATNANRLWQSWWYSEHREIPILHKFMDWRLQVLSKIPNTCQIFLISDIVPIKLSWTLRDPGAWGVHISRAYCYLRMFLDTDLTWFVIMYKLVQSGFAQLWEPDWGLRAGENGATPNIGHFWMQVTRNNTRSIWSSDLSRRRERFARPRWSNERIWMIQSGWVIVVEIIHIS